ncbi:MAG: aminotransferase class V-fold PLP-dependent enzyme [Bacteroidota bacterium]
MKSLYFTPGPSQLYFTAEEHIKTALKEQIPSISHRSATFQSIFQHAVENLRTLVNLPDNFHILFTASATEIWERLIQNCVDNSSLHLVNGAFSQRFYDMAKMLNINADEIRIDPGHCVTGDDIKVEGHHELIAFTHNETSTGVSQPLEDIYSVREKHPDALIAVDVVSSIPYVNLDFDKIDSAYFSVQKCFGLPAGLGVWFVNDRCLAKAEERLAKGQVIGSYHSLPSLVKQSKKNQTPETPNVLNIYLLRKVAEDMNTKGLDMIRRETEYKSAVLYNTLENHPDFDLFVKEQSWRSKTVIVAETNLTSQRVIENLQNKKLLVGSGYGNFKDQHIRIANFPTHSKEQVEMLADTLETLTD